VHRLVDGRFATAIELTADNDALTTPLLPGFAVALSEIFAPGPGLTTAARVDAAARQNAMVTTNAEPREPTGTSVTTGIRR
jgi:hypothetical protein